MAAEEDACASGELPARRHEMETSFSRWLRPRSVSRLRVPGPARPGARLAASGSFSRTPGPFGPPRRGELLLEREREGRGLRPDGRVRGRVPAPAPDGVWCRRWRCPPGRRPRFLAGGTQRRGFLGDILKNLLWREGEKPPRVSSLIIFCMKRG